MKAKWRLKKTLYGRKYDPIHREEEPGDDPAYLDWIRSLPCALRTFPFRGVTRCWGPTEAHHPTGAGLALKASDRDAIPLCMGHHVPEFHRLAGAFKGWVHDELRDWQQRMTRAYQALHGKRQGELSHGHVQDRR